MRLEMNEGRTDSMDATKYKHELHYEYEKDSSPLSKSSSSSSFPPPLMTLSHSDAGFVPDILSGSSETFPSAERLEDDAALTGGAVVRRGDFGGEGVSSSPHRTTRDLLDLFELFELALAVLYLRGFMRMAGLDDQLAMDGGTSCGRGAMQEDGRKAEGPVTQDSRGRSRGAVATDVRRARLKMESMMSLADRSLSPAPPSSACADDEEKDDVGGYHRVSQ
jgi:hypothetical protein